MEITLNKSRTTFITSEILSFALLIGRTAFFPPVKFYRSRVFTSGIYRSRSVLVAQNLAFVTQKFADKISGLIK